MLTLEDLPAADGFTRPAVGRHDAAYVLYTSGSTGRPKGVVITHAAIVNRVLWMQDAFGLYPADRVLHKTPIGFDVSAWELFWPLLTGATIVLASPGGHQDAEYLAGTIARQGVTVSHFVPSMLQLFLDEPTARDLPALRQVMCSGEELPPDLVQRFRQRLPTVELHNLYGPTEAAVDVTWWDCARRAPPGVVPIGHPIANTTAYVLDRRLQQVPDGVPGEMYLGGVQLARGYVNRPDLTAGAFVAQPAGRSRRPALPHRRQVRWLPDGSLQFLGRLDQQVKLRGYRIELGEVEHVLAGHPSVREAAVAVRDGADGPQLVAYLTASGTVEPDPQTIRAHLQGELPGYMLPSSFTVLAAMPRSHNGKLDRAALPDPAPVGRSHGAAPATPQEELIAAAYREVLDLNEVDVTASFFDLGGNSFDAVRVIRRIEGANVGLLVSHPSVRELAAALLQQEIADRRLLRLTEPGSTSHTLVCVPYGGGSAITYHPLARALSPEIALYAVAQPGHEMGGEPELRPIEEVAADCVEAMNKIDDGPISVYGHCAGVALAVELVRQLEAAGRPVQRLFVAGSFPFYEPGPIGRVVQSCLSTLVTRGVIQVSATSVGLTRNGTAEADAAEMRFLQSSGGFDGEMDADGLAFVMRAFRHDIAEAPRYFSTHAHRRREDPVLSAPITFIAGTADPFTPGYKRRGRHWKRYSSSVEVATVPDGGHYFHQHQPEVVARVLESRIEAT